MHQGQGQVLGRGQHSTGEGLSVSGWYLEVRAVVWACRLSDGGGKPGAPGN